MSPGNRDLWITTAQIKRERLSRLPYSLLLTCTRTAGWELWNITNGLHRGELLAGEYAGPEDWLVLDVDGCVIADSRRRAALDRMTEDASGTGLYSGQPEDYAAALKKARKRGH